MILNAISEFNSHDSAIRLNAKDDFFDVPEDESSVIRLFSRSFSMASRRLPIEMRGNVEKLYAWCRWCDEAVDSAPSSEVAKSRLSYLREDVSRIFDGHPVRHPASHWLADLVASKGIQKAEALALLTGLEMDLRSWQVRDEEELIRYCYHVAGVVGLMMCRVMGVNDRTAMKHAVDLGIAMQLTNIARDVAEDLRNGRGYLPKNWIDLELPNAIASLPIATHTDCSNAISNESVRASVERILGLAEGYYRSGLAGLSYLPSSCRLAICLAAMIYREIGREILRLESRVMDGRIAISPMRIAWIASMVWIGNSVHQLAVKSLGCNFADWFLSFSFNSVSGDVVMNDARYLAYLGLSLTSFMASGLFVMVSINPKDPSYSMLPMAHAIGSLAVGIVTNVLAVRAARSPRPVPISR